MSVRLHEVAEEYADARQKHPEWRDGQAAFNALCRVAPVLAERIRGTGSDPYSDDARLPAFWESIGWWAA